MKFYTYKITINPSKTNNNDKYIVYLGGEKRIIIPPSFSFSTTEKLSYAEIRKRIEGTEGVLYIEEKYDNFPFNEIT